MKVGRNDPCPCGSGKKYKKCCLEADEAARPSKPQGKPEERLAERVFTLRDEAILFADRKLAGGGAGEFTHCARDIEAAWKAWAPRFEGRSAAELLLESKPGSFTSADRRILEAEGQAWLSVWEVAEVRGRQVTLVDRLLGATAKVPASLFNVVDPGDMLLGRLVQIDGTVVIDGAENHVLPKAGFGEDIGELCASLGGDVTVETLRKTEIWLTLARGWNDLAHAGHEHDHDHDHDHGSDEDAFVDDLFDIDPSQREEIERRLLELEGVERAEEGDILIPTVMFEEDGQVGVVTFDGATMQLESLGVSRADDVCAVLEDALGDLAKHRERTVTPFDSIDASGLDMPLIEDVFEMAVGARPEIERRLLALEGAEQKEEAIHLPSPDPEDEENFGRVLFEEKVLRVEILGEPNADALRERVTGALGELVRLRERVVLEPFPEEGEEGDDDADDAAHEGDDRA